MKHPKATLISQQEKKNQATITSFGSLFPFLLIQAVFPRGKHGFTGGRRELHFSTNLSVQVSRHGVQQQLHPSLHPEWGLALPPSSPTARIYPPAPKGGLITATAHHSRQFLQMAPIWKSPCTQPGKHTPFWECWV